MRDKRSIEQKGKDGDMDWSKSNAELAKEFGAKRRDTISTIRMKYAPHTRQVKRHNIDWINLEWTTKSNKQIAEENNISEGMAKAMRKRKGYWTLPHQVRMYKIAGYSCFDEQGKLLDKGYYFKSKKQEGYIY